MIRVGTSSQQLVDIHNSDQLLLTVAGSAETTTRAPGASVVLAAAAHFRVALQDQELWVKETQAVTPLVAEVAQLAAAEAVLAVWALQETLHKDKVDQALQLLSLDLQSRMQVVAAVVVGR
jgi:hypothetical protein